LLEDIVVLILQDDVSGELLVIAPRIMTLHSHLMWRLQALRRDLKPKPEASCDEVGYVQSVNDSRNITKNGQQDVDQKVGTATTLRGNVSQSL
jgi:hypothetical protein